MKKFALPLLATILLTGGGIFTSCENFLDGAEIKEEIESQIAYANAPAYIIRVDCPENSGIIKSPAGGEISKKVTDVFTVRFEPASDREFIRWRVLDIATGNEVTDDEYLVLSALTDSETECTFKKAPEGEIRLSISPEVAERPQILSYTPLYVADGTRKDSSIQVIFDYDMDPESIYYTENEINSLLESGIQSTNLLYSEVNGETKCCGYKIRLGNSKNGYYYEYYFKNIAITDNETGKNLNEHFNVPVFENPRILTITTRKDNELPPWSQILVKLERKFSYKVGEKPVMMNSAKKWIYMVTTEIDANPPLTPGENDVKIFLSNGTTTVPKLSTIPSTPWNTSSSSIPYNNDKKLHFKLEVKDRESGPARSFKVCVQKVGTYEDKNGYQTVSSAVKSTSFNYQNVSGQTAVFDKAMDISNLIDGDGVYGVSFVFSDRSDRSISYPSNRSLYYFIIDTTPPHVYYRAVAESGDSEACRPGVGSVYLDWKGSNQWGNGNWVSKDLYKTTIKYKKHSESSYSNTVTTGVGVTNKTITGLLEGTEYDFIISHEDFNGNPTESYYWSTKTLYGPPKKPENLRMISKTSTTIKVAWDPPSSGSDFDIYHIYWTWMLNDGRKKFKSVEARVSKETTEYTLTITGGIDLTNWPWVNVQVSTIKDPGPNEVWCNEGPATLEVTYP